MTNITDSSNASQNIITISSVGQLPIFEEKYRSLFSSPLGVTLEMKGQLVCSNIKLEFQGNTFTITEQGGTVHTGTISSLNHKMFDGVFLSGLSDIQPVLDKNKVSYTIPPITIVQPLECLVFGKLGEEDIKIEVTPKFSGKRVNDNLLILSTLFQYNRDAQILEALSSPKQSETVDDSVVTEPAVDEWEDTTGTSLIVVNDKVAPIKSMKGEVTYSFHIEQKNMDVSKSFLFDGSSQVCTTTSYISEEESEEESEELLTINEALTQINQIMFSLEEDEDGYYSYINPQTITLEGNELLCSTPEVECTKIQVTLLNNIKFKIDDIDEIEKVTSLLVNPVIAPSYEEPLRNVSQLIHGLNMLDCAASVQDLDKIYVWGEVGLISPENGQLHTQISFNKDTVHVVDVTVGSTKVPTVYKLTQPELWMLLEDEQSFFTPLYSPIIQKTQLEIDVRHYNSSIGIKWGDISNLINYKDKIISRLNRAKKNDKELILEQLKQLNLAMYHSSNEVDQEQ